MNKRTIVAKRDELEIEDPAFVFSYSANPDCIPILCIYVKPGLRSIRLLHNLGWLVEVPMGNLISAPH
jgi:hypothetical protein